MTTVPIIPASKSINILNMHANQTGQSGSWRRKKHHNISIFAAIPANNNMISIACRFSITVCQVLTYVVIICGLTSYERIGNTKCVHHIQNLSARHQRTGLKSDLYKQFWPSCVHFSIVLFDWTAHESSTDLKEQTTYIPRFDRILAPLSSNSSIA